MPIRNMFATLLTFCLFLVAARGDDTAGSQKAESKSQLSVLEGILKIHPKYLWKYYIAEFANGQQCALFEDEKLKNIKPGSLIHVEGRIGTRLYPGGTEKNPSPFGRTWYIYMEVESVRVSWVPEEGANKTDPVHLPGTAPR